MTDPKEAYAGMKWINAPKRSKWEIDDDGRLKLSVPKETDLWRGTKHGFTKEDAPYFFKKVGRLPGDMPYQGEIR